MLASDDYQTQMLQVRKLLTISSAFFQLPRLAAMQTCFDAHTLSTYLSWQLTSPAYLHEVPLQHDHFKPTPIYEHAVQYQTFHCRQQRTVIPKLSVWGGRLNHFSFFQSHSKTSTVMMKFKLSGIYSKTKRTPKTSFLASQPVFMSTLNSCSESLDAHCQNLFQYRLATASWGERKEEKKNLNTAGFQRI